MALSARLGVGLKVSEEDGLEVNVTVELTVGVLVSVLPGGTFVNVGLMDDVTELLGVAEGDAVFE